MICCWLSSCYVHFCSASCDSFFFCSRSLNLVYTLFNGQSLCLNYDFLIFHLNNDCWIQKTQKLWQKCVERVLISLKFRFRLILISFTFPFSLWVLRLILNLKKIFNTSSKTEIVYSLFSMRDLCFLKHGQLFSLAWWRFIIC